jgi:hypothetical protein
MFSNPVSECRLGQLNRDRASPCFEQARATDIS